MITAMITQNTLVESKNQSKIYPPRNTNDFVDYSTNQKKLARSKDNFLPEITVTYLRKKVEGILTNIDIS